MINDQEYITTELKKVLEKMIILSSTRLNNLDNPTAIREYKKRFDIQEMFKDFKGGGFNIEKTWCENIQYIRMLYLCVSIAYCWMITLGTSCSKDKKNKRTWEGK